MTDPVVPNRVTDTAKGGPSLLACLVCRHKHLKCDGITPVCGRCAASGTECQYTPSRRGYKGQPKRRRASPSPSGQAVADSYLNDLRTPGLVEVPPPFHWGHQASALYPYSNITTPVPTVAPSVQHHLSSSSSNSSSPVINSNNSHNNSNSANNMPQMVQSARVLGHPLTPDSSPSLLVGDRYLVDVYYNYFHPSHPVLPPLRLLYRRNVPLYLEQVIKFIGAHFTSSSSSEAYRPSVISSVVEHHEDTVEMVQALLLLTVVLEARNERTVAGDCLTKAVHLAFELGLHHGDYATTMGEGDPIREESLRRTWWELFMVECMMTALGVRHTFSTSMVPLEVPLPCEERIYQDGLTPPRPLTIAQFDERIFADDEQEFSSYCYRLEAIRIMGRVVGGQNTTENEQDNVQAIDARISSWFHHLPEAKTELIRPDGSVDEMMFQATMVVNAASIRLNFPRSDLLSSPAVAAEVMCGDHTPYSMPVFSHHVHAMKAIKGASELSSLAGLGVPVVKHTPFFICSLMLSSIVQLAACSAKAGRMPDPSRDRLALTIGVFKSLSRTWAISQEITKQIKAVARDVMDLGLRSAMDVDMVTLLDSSRYWLQDTTR